MWWDPACAYRGSHASIHHTALHGSGATRTGAGMDATKSSLPDCGTSALSQGKTSDGCNSVSGDSRVDDADARRPTRRVRGSRGVAPLPRRGRGPPRSVCGRSRVISSVAVRRSRTIFQVPATKPSSVNVLIGSLVPVGMPRTTSAGDIRDRSAYDRSRFSKSYRNRGGRRRLGGRAGRVGHVEQLAPALVAERERGPAGAARRPRAASSGRTTPGRP